MLEKSFAKLGLTMALWCVLGAASASANVIYDYSYSFRFFSTELEYSSPVFITTPLDVPLADLTFAFCTLGCADSYHFQPGSPDTFGFDIAFDYLFPPGALTHDGSYTMTLDGIPYYLTVSGSPAATVPEPASGALAATGLALCLIRLAGRRRKNGLEIPPQ